MPTITLTIDQETLDAMIRGEAVQLTATLKAKKPRVERPAEDVEAHKKVTEMWAAGQSTIPVARALRAFKKLPCGLTEIVIPLDTAIDWNRGREYPPEWFVKDYAVWQERAGMDPFEAELERQEYRSRLKLKG